MTDYPKGDFSYMDFSYMDFCSGYRQIDIDESDRKKKTFLLSEGQNKFKVMPFGLC